jgi:hypothetical protein
MAAFADSPCRPARVQRAHRLQHLRLQGGRLIRYGERAAIIYQHEARGADLAITSAIDAHIETAKAGPGHPGDGTPRAQPKSGNGPLMAHGDQQDVNKLVR